MIEASHQHSLIHWVKTRVQMRVNEWLFLKPGQVSVRNINTSDLHVNKLRETHSALVRNTFSRVGSRPQEARRMNPWVVVPANAFSSFSIYPE